MFRAILKERFRFAPAAENRFLAPPKLQIRLCSTVKSLHLSLACTAPRADEAEFQKNPQFLTTQVLRFTISLLLAHKTEIEIKMRAANI